MLLVVIVNSRHGNHPRVLSRGKAVNSLILFMPIHDPANKWRNEGSSSFGTGYCLGKRENQRQVASDALLLEDFSGLDSFPSSSNLDQNSRFVDSNLLIELSIYHRLQVSSPS